jgi:hypothetical protein
MFDTTLLMSWIIFSSIGMWYFIYWKKSSKIIPKISGLILMVYPYFMEDTVYLIIIGILLIILPMIIKLEF